MSESTPNDNNDTSTDNSSTVTKKRNLNETIQIYLRLRPTRKNTYDHQHLIISPDKQGFAVKIPVEKQGYIDNTIRKHTFKFDRIFDSPTTQEEIFNEVAKEVIDSAIDGYNGTIFAYGQTGSGKTYTITGGVESIELRGILPRTLSYLFDETKKRTLFQWKIYVSYLEIYNNDGYDLLHDSTEKKYELESLPKVKIRENRSGQLILSNLSIHQIDNFQEGMALLMLGDDNRVVAETPKNDASTRSHCLFMIQIESQKIGEDKKTLSKLHIVDLSGSEAPGKNDYTGIRMTEALNINISLFYLENVIIALNEKAGYIPYRNSMMTMCLRDSIGGNCKTRMIANLSSDFEDVMESLSTCRFAMRVALVKNTAVVNEIVDPNVLIQRQKGEIEELKNELAMIKGKNQKSFLDQNDIDECHKIVEEFLLDDTFQKKIQVKDRLMIQECFNIIKQKYKDMEKKLKASNGEIVLDGNQDLDKIIQLETENKKLNAEIEKLKEMLKNREDELKVVLQNMENKENNTNQTGGHKTLLAKLQQEENEAISKIKTNILGDLVKFENLSNANITRLSNNNNTMINNNETINLNSNDTTLLKQNNSNTTNTTNYAVPPPLLKEINSANTFVVGIEPDVINFNMLNDRNTAYLFFRKNYYLANVEIKNQKDIKEKMSQGKTMSEEYKKLDSKMEGLKKKIEECKKIKILDKSKEEEMTQKETELTNEFMQLRPIRKKQREDLLALKNTIQNMQTIDNNFQITRTKNFEFWYEVMIKKLEFESKYGKINLSTGFANPNNVSLGMMGSNTNNTSTILNQSSISQATDLNERLQKRVEQFKSNLNYK